jgi:hypothetical protein
MFCDLSPSDYNCPRFIIRNDHVHEPTTICRSQIPLIAQLAERKTVMDKVSS